LPIDEIDFDYEVRDVFTHKGDEPEDGCLVSGLFLDGGGWDLTNMLLVEP
jgi:hypothetical protein